MTPAKIEVNSVNMVYYFMYEYAGRANLQQEK